MTDPYETWKSQGRPGGSFEAWQASQGGGGGFNSQYAPQAMPQPAQPQYQAQPQAAPQAGGGGDWNQAYQNFYGNTDWRDTNISKAQWDTWAADASTHGGSDCPPDKPFKSRAGADGRQECAFKPDDCPEGQHVVGSDTNGSAHCVGGTGDGSGGGGGGGNGGGGGGGNGAPQFNAPKFQAPSYEEAMSDPGYQFALKQANDTMQHSQAAQGMLRTGGSLSDLMNMNQGMAAQQYQNVYNRAANTYGLNYQGAKDEFAPKYGAWELGQNQDLSRWTTNQNTALSKWNTTQNNIYGLVNQPMSPFPTWS